MENLLTEIKALAKDGYENAVMSNTEKCKDAFLSIMLKIEISLNTPVTIRKNFTSNIPSRTYEKINDIQKQNMYLVAYCFSYFDHTSLYPAYKQDKAFEIAAEKLGVKKNTLKNARDWFDGHNDNHRKGWWQSPLPDDMAKVKKIYGNKSKEEIISLAKSILGIK